MKATVSKLGDAIDVLSGFAYEAELFNETEGLPVIRIRDVVRGFSNTRYSGDVDARFIVKNGEILIGMDGNFNTARWTGGPALLNQRVCKVTARPDILDEGFLFHLLPKELKKIEDTTAFVTVKHLSVKGIRDIDIALPPLPEQRRIAAILDQADALRAKRREALAQLDTLTQSIFIEMFGESEKNFCGNTIVQLAEVTTRITDGTHLTPKFISSGVPFIFVKNFENGYINFETDKFISEDEHATLYKRCPVEPGDVLYTTVGATYGQAATVGKFTKFAFQRHVAHLKPDVTKIVPEFLGKVMQLSFVKRQADRWARGAAQPTVNLTELRQFAIPLPNFDEQLDFVERSRVIEKLKVVKNDSLNQLDTLFASLQHRAFQGEL